MADRTAALGDLIVAAIHTATADLRANAATVIARLAEIEARALVTDRDHAATRERLAAVEARTPIPGTPGRDGAPGADGFTCDELVATQDPDGQHVTLGYRRGEVTKTIGSVFLPIPIYRGVFEPGRTYAPGDLVTCGGSVWHCHTPTDARPGNGAPAWVLAVKCGRDGRDLRAEARP